MVVKLEGEAVIVEGKIWYKIKKNSKWNLLKLR